MADRPAPPREGIEVHRIYEAVDAPGYRVLVDRLWPRGVSKDDAHLDEWLKDVAPTTELRRYGHDPARFEDFARRYEAELGRPPAADAVRHIHELARGRPIALLTATRDVERSGARVLCDHLVAGAG